MIDIKTLGHITLGGIIFTTENNAHSQAIQESSSTVRNPASNGVFFTHCGIVASPDMKWDTVIIHSSPNKGVHIDSLKDFLHSATWAVAETVCDEQVAIRAVSLAEKNLGRPYNHTLYPDREGLYCSQLVTVCYLNKDGTSYFESTPMNFRSPDGSMPKFWTETFQAYRTQIPESIPGSNPHKLYLQRDRFR